MATKKDIELKVRAGNGIEAGMSSSQMFAALSSRGGLAAALIPRYITGNDGVDSGDVLIELQKAGDEVNTGNLNRMERVLVNQALTLDVMFNDLAQRAKNQDYLSSMETLFRLALKCQAQSRATLEAIGHLKNPTPYIKQANIAHGHQQVNNGTPLQPRDVRAGAHTSAGNSETSPSELLEAGHEQGLDFGAAATAGRADSRLETVGAVHRA